MAGTGTKRSKSGSLEVEEELREEMGQREEGRRTNEQNEQQDLNQGMATGTHSSAHGGIHWGPSYRMRSKIEEAPQQKNRLRPGLMDFICNATAKMATALRIGSSQKTN